jgi:hypothetical protein
MTTDMKIKNMVNQVEVVFEGDVLKAAAGGTDINEVSSGMVDCNRAHRLWIVCNCLAHHQHVAFSRRNCGVLNSCTKSTGS